MDPQSATVSIIVPTWQRARLLPRCLASIAAQAGAWECIVVDDGSTDDTAAVVDRFGPRFRLIRRAHEGVSAARNAGLAAATGAWIGFLDSDDEYLPGALATLRRGLAVAGTRVVCGGLTGNLRVDRARTMDGGIEVRDAHRHALGASIEGPRVQLIAALFHREVFAACGGFDPTFHSSEDRELLVRVTARYPVTFVRTFVARYHEGHGGGASDASLVDGTKLVALRRLLRDHPDHLAVLDAVAAVRGGDLAAARSHVGRALAGRTRAERDALVVRLIYLLTYPVSRLRDAVERSSAQLDALDLPDAAAAVRIWAAWSLARAGAIRDAAALARGVSLRGAAKAMLHR